jgi:signal transduction histidine kinase
MSLRAKLTLWFTAVLAIALALFGVFVFAVVTPALDAEIDASVQTRAHDLALSVRYNNGKLTLPTKSRVPDSPFSSPSMYSIVRDERGTVVFRSDTLQGGELPATRATMARARVGEPVFETVLLAGQSIRLYTAPILLNGVLIGYVQVGRNLADIDSVLSHLRAWLLPSAAIVLIAAAAGGWLLAWLALRPMDRLGHEARAIGLARRIDRRLPAPRISDEVGRLAETFNEMLDRLDSAFEAQQRFVADASHELRTPLTTIQGNLDFLRRSPDLTEAERAEALDDVVAETARMSRLVNGLLGLARADAGRHLERHLVELRPILATCARDAELLARGTGTVVEFDDSGLAPGAAMRANSDRLVELVLILVDNAVKYNRPGGRVRVTASSRDSVHVLVVEDDGRGISPEDLPHIFERFYRSTSARADDGTGLGLAIARWIAQEHEADIAVESTPGVGSIFSVTLPAAPVVVPV